MTKREKSTPSKKEKHWSLDTIRKQQQIVDYAKALPGGNTHSNHAIACKELFCVSYSHKSMTDVRNYMSHLGGKAKKRKKKHTVTLPTPDEWFTELANHSSRQHFLHPEDQRDLIEALGIS